MRLHMDKSSYKSAENYLGKGKSNRNSGTTSAQTMGRWQLKVYRCYLEV